MWKSQIAIFLKIKLGYLSVQWFCYLCILCPDVQKSPKTQDNSSQASCRMQRMVDQFEDFLVEYPVHAISVAAV